MLGVAATSSRIWTCSWSSVDRLATAAARYAPDIEEPSRCWRILDGYYFPTRYPNGLPDGIPARIYGPEAALSAVDLATEVVEWVRGRLSPEDPA